MELDAEIKKFIDDSNSHYPADAKSFSVEQQRYFYNLLCKAYHYDYPNGVSAVDSEHQISGRSIACRTYSPEQISSDTLILYCHGGGYVVGDLESHDSICAELSHQSELRLIAVDYSLAPEYLFPTALDEVDAIYLELCESYDKIIVCGDSAGANLIAGLCIRHRHKPTQPLAQLLIYPGLGGETLQLSSYTENSHAPGLTTKDVHYYKDIRNPDPSNITNPEFNPLALDDYSGLCACVCISADIDPLRDDCKLYVERLNQHNVEAVWHNQPGLIHGYLRARHVSERARNSFALICTELKRLALGQI